MVPTVAHAASERLALVALSAATELDKMSRGKPASNAPLQEFREVLSDFPGWLESIHTGTLALDPISSEMFTAAVTSVTKKRMGDLADLSKALKAIIEELHSISNEDRAHELGMIKTFCLAIHHFVMKTSSQTGLIEQGVFYNDYNYS